MTEEADAHGRPTHAHSTLYRTWSEGGTGLLLTGNVMIDGRYLERAGNVVLEDDRALPLFSAWAEAAQSAGSDCWVQLSHPGRQCPRLVNGRPLSPSDVQLDVLFNFGAPRPMSEADIEDVIARFVRSALLVKRAGFRGVQIHCAHGYLLSQFLSPLTNRRTDIWGGSLENRARIIRHIIQRVRHAVGDTFPIGVKLNSADFLRGGFNTEECVRVAHWLAEDGVDLLEISGGTHEQLSLLGVEPTEVRESTRKREAYFVEYARQISDAACIPLMITGGFRRRSIMEEVIQSGEVDIVGLARPLCTQPACSTHLIKGQIDQLDAYERALVLGKGFWGNNSPLNLIKAANAFGQIGYYYWQIIRLARGEEPQPELSTVRACVRHPANDVRLAMRRKVALRNPSGDNRNGDYGQTNSQKGPSIESFAPEKMRR